MGVTIKDVAAEAGVSITTVSFVMNGKNKISRDITDRVMRVAERLGYTPSASAKNLAQRRSGNIVLFVPDIPYLQSSIFFSNLIAGIISVVNASSYRLCIRLLGEDYEKNLVDGKEMDGAIVIHPSDSGDFVGALSQSPRPVVIVGRPVKEIENAVTYVDVDNTSIAYNLTKHLLELGHRKMAFLLGPRGYTLTNDEERGIRLALNDYHCRPGDETILYGTFAGFQPDPGLEALFGGERPPTAVLAAGDTQAVSTVRALNRLGLRVPEDVSVACMSETNMTVQYSPAITGASTHTFDLGVTAVSKLIRLITRHTVCPSNEIIPYEIVIRESTASA